MPAGRPIGSLNRKTSSKATELFGPHVDEAIATLKQIAANDASHDSDRIAACKIICEYGLGKPIQPISSGQVEDGNDIPIGVKVTFV